MESPESIFVMVLAAFGEYKAENYYFCNVHFETSTQKQVNIGCLVQLWFLEIILAGMKIGLLTLSDFLQRSKVNWLIRGERRSDAQLT